MTHVLPLLIAATFFLTVLLPDTVVGATIAPVSNALTSPATHVVAPGDTLYSIARRYGTTVDALKAANGLTSNVIWIGQTLHVGSSSPQPSTGTYHTVVRGDTLYSLARRYGTTVDAIMRANWLTSPNIYVGQRLIISSSPVPPVGGTTYTVVRGDTLYSIARRYGTTVEAIKALNNISGNIIYIGQLLRIPQSATFPTATPIATRTTTPATTLTPNPTTTIPPTQTPATTAVSTPTPIATSTPSTATPIPTSTPTGQAPVQQGVIGQDMFVGDIRWKILSATNSGQQLEPINTSLENKVTAGQFIVVRFEVENQGASPTSYDHFDLVDSQNRTFSNYLDGLFGYVPENERCALLDQLQPDLTLTCTIVFEVAANASGFRAFVGDLNPFTGNEAYINLGF